MIGILELFYNGLQFIELGGLLGWCKCGDIELLLEEGNFSLWLLEHDGVS